MTTITMNVPDELVLKAKNIGIYNESALSEMVTEFLKNQIVNKEKSSQTTLADIVAGKRLESFTGDPVEIQRQMRDEWN